MPTIGSSSGAITKEIPGPPGPEGPAGPAGSPGAPGSPGTANVAYLNTPFVYGAVGGNQNGHLVTLPADSFAAGKELLIRSYGKTANTATKTCSCVVEELATMRANLGFYGVASVGGGNFFWEINANRDSVAGKINLAAHLDLWSLDPFTVVKQWHYFYANLDYALSNPLTFQFKFGSGPTANDWIQYYTGAWYLVGA